MNSSYTDKEILGDALVSAKFATENYNTFSNECAHETVRTAMMQILKEEHEIQKEVFHMMASKGYYPTPAAEEKKIQEAREKYQNCVK